MTEKNPTIPKLSMREHRIMSLLNDRGPMYGLEIVEKTSGEIKKGTVYPTLQRMSDKNYLSSEELQRTGTGVGGPTRVYQLTDYGKTVLDKNDGLSRMMTEDNLTLEAAATLLWVSEGTLLDWIERREIESFEGLEGEIRIPSTSLLTEESKRLFEKGLLWQTIQDWQEAIAYAEDWLGQAIESNPKYCHPVHELGRVYFTFWKYYEAEPLLKRAVELNPDAFQPSMNLGMNYREMQRYENAQVCFRNVIRVNPTFAAAHHELGWCLYMQGLSYPREKLFEALAVLRDAMSIEPKDSSADIVGNLLSAAYLDTFDRDAAMAFANEVNDSYPRTAKAIRWRLGLNP